MRRGSGDPLVLVHGTGSQRQMWDPVVGRLAAERDVIALDLPGFGESPPLPGEPAVTPEPVAPIILGNPLGRTLSSAQLVGRPWRMTAEQSIGATRNLAAAPA